MARSEHLPIYKASYDLCLHLEQVVHGFSRYHKYTLGTDLRDGARRALKLVVRANALRDRVAVLLELREQLEELKVLLRLGQDHRRSRASAASSTRAPRSSSWPSRTRAGSRVNVRVRAGIGWRCPKGWPSRGR